MMRHAIAMLLIASVAGCGHGSNAAAQVGGALAAIALSGVAQLITAAVNEERRGGGSHTPDRVEPPDPNAPPSAYTSSGWRPRVECARRRWFQERCGHGAGCVYELSDGRVLSGEPVPPPVARFCLGE